MRDGIICHGIRDGVHALDINVQLIAQLLAFGVKVNRICSDIPH